jgi:hypothetical protein
MLSCGGSTQIQCGFHFAERHKVLLEHSWAMMTQVRAYVILNNTEDVRKPRSVACVACVGLFQLDVGISEGLSCRYCRCC